MHRCHWATRESWSWKHTFCFPGLPPASGGLTGKGLLTLAGKPGGALLGLSHFSWPHRLSQWLGTRHWEPPLSHSCPGQILDTTLWWRHLGSRLKGRMNVQWENGHIPDHPAPTPAPSSCSPSCQDNPLPGHPKLDSLNPHPTLQRSQTKLPSNLFSTQSSCSHLLRTEMHICVYAAPAANPPAANPASSAWPHACPGHLVTFLLLPQRPSFLPWDGLTLRGLP